ncbi:MAG TPA: alpha/beta hydrolase [Vicinamibacterales bacterium]
MPLPGEINVTPVMASGAAPDQGLLMLHGIYGRGRNWSPIARRLVERRPDWGVWLADLREHGDSRGFAPPHTVAAAAADIERHARAAVGFAPGFTRAGDAALRAVLGHSFGGKVALALAMPLAGMLDQIWIVDSTPDVRTPDGAAWRMLKAVRRLPSRFASRAEAIAGLVGQGFSEGVASWMASNLTHTPNGYEWTLDFDVMEALLRDFFTTDLWAIVESPPGDLVLHFVKATQSDTLTEAACERIEAAGRSSGRVRVHRVEGGHWLNTDNPAAIIELLAAELG